MTIDHKITIALSLPGAGWNILSEARVADASIHLETERHAQAMRDIEERFNLEAWRHVEKHWTPDELQACQCGNPSRKSVVSSPIDGPETCHDCGLILPA